MVVGTDQQEEGKKRDIKKRGGVMRGGRRSRRRRRRGSISKLKKEGYSYRGAPQASNSGGDGNSLPFSCFYFFPPPCPHFIPLRLRASRPLWRRGPFAVWSRADRSGPCPLPFIRRRPPHPSPFIPSFLVSVRSQGHTCNPLRSSFINQKSRRS